MKSPWKFFAQFISQRGSAETRKSSIRHDPDSEASQDEAQPSSGLSLEATETPRGVELDKGRPIRPLTPSRADQSQSEIHAVPGIPVRGDVEQVHASADRNASRSSTQAHALRLESQSAKKSRQTSRGKGPRGARNINVGLVAQSITSAAERTSARPVSSQGALFDDLTSLDEEIKQLKIQLAHKLHLQNVQLRKMLERFDVS